jgi:hypothetical protein
LNPVFQKYRLLQPTSSCAAPSAHFKYIGKIRGELDAQRQFSGVGPIVLDPNPFETASRSKKLASIDVNRSVSDKLIAAAHFRIGKIHGQNSVIVANRGTEQERTPSIYSQLKRREITRIAVKKTKFAGTDRLKIARTIEYRECVTTQENASTIVGQR